MCVCGGHSPPTQGEQEGGQQVWAPTGLVLVVPRNRSGSGGGSAEKVTQKPDGEGEKVEGKSRAALFHAIFLFYLFLITPQSAVY